MPTKIIKTVAEVRSVVAKWQADGQTVGLVPTMGAFHDGHMALVDRAKAVADRVVTTLFVNPTQFNNKEDLEKYPNSVDQDLALLEARDVDILFMPDVTEMYPEGFATEVSVPAISAVLEGKFRPGHFEGVATVCCKLFNQTGANYACFGEKDFQQLSLIRRMAADLNIPIEIVPVPTVREPSGLAMSSRNRRLKPEELEIAPELKRSMKLARVQILAGEPVEAALKEAKARILAAGFREIDYLELRQADALHVPAEDLAKPARLLAAAWLGKIRLIDNIAVEAD